MNSDVAITHVLKAEGGFVDNPADAGGPTKFGITLSTLSSYRGMPATAVDVVALTETEARRIYLEAYWTPTGLDALADARVATVVFDQAVNGGPRTAVRMLQIALGRSITTVDGVLGLATANVANRTDPGLLIARLVIEAQRRYLDLWRARPSQGVFLAGWIARTWRYLDLPRPDTNSF